MDNPHTHATWDTRHKTKTKKKKKITHQKKKPHEQQGPLYASNNFSAIAFIMTSTLVYIHYN